MFLYVQHQLFCINSGHDIYTNGKHKAQIIYLESVSVFTQLWREGLKIAVFRNTIPSLDQRRQSQLLIL